MAKSEIRCTTPACVEAVAKYGENYHNVKDMEHKQPPKWLPDAIAGCERCGGYFNGDKWEHKCKLCGRDVEPGQLAGFFVPHRCRECDAKVIAEDKAAGWVCSRCHSVYAYCCC